MELGEEPLVQTDASIFQDLCYNYRDQLSAGIICAGWDRRKGGQVSPVLFWASPYARIFYYHGPLCCCRCFPFLWEACVFANPMLLEALGAPISMDGLMLHTKTRWPSRSARSLCWKVRVENSTPMCLKPHALHSQLQPLLWPSIVMEVAEESATSPQSLLQELRGRSSCMMNFHSITSSELHAICNSFDQPVSCLLLMSVI